MEANQLGLAQSERWRSCATNRLVKQRTLDEMRGAKVNPYGGWAWVA
jgi:hypothetical protein